MTVFMRELAPPEYSAKEAADLMKRAAHGDPEAKRIMDAFHAEQDREMEKQLKGLQ